ncbi:hypothetical protein [Actibacterium sp. 188UL27-1]|uniref:hypothetical protein n=1 Tax=Actibacterium sp. 188UL27-1 TaxID=2786961 RepID=UPI00195E46DC|nr:hypothetical protein [Actibacterium sp. 188UL27-1]MBM7065995.1 hypothetical protein [Actibacterium sp. 188UL27-1]
MIKFFTASIFAIALTLTSLVPSPVQARDRDDVARLVIGAAALAIIAKSIDDKRKRDKKREKAKRAKKRSHAQVPVVRGTPRRHGGHNAIATIPGSCERIIDTRNGPRRFFGRPCLDRTGFSGRLPQTCLRTLDLPRRTVAAYGKRCLLNRGVRIRG